MRIGIPDFDEERKVMVGIIELLDIDPNHALNNEFFLTRFGVLEEAVKALYIHEERLMITLNVPIEEREAHFADHSRILLMLTDVYLDSMAHKLGNALEVYQRVRTMLEDHILNIADNLKNYVPTAPK